MNKRKQLGSLFAPNGYKAGYGLLSSPWGGGAGGVEGMEGCKWEEMPA